LDNDGDIDIASKLWCPRKDNANEGRKHADFLCLSENRDRKALRILIWRNARLYRKVLAARGPAPMQSTSWVSVPNVAEPNGQAACWRYANSTDVGHIVSAACRAGRFGFYIIGRAKQVRFNWNIIVSLVALLHTFEQLPRGGVASPHTQKTLSHIQALKEKHQIDYDTHASYCFVERGRRVPKRTELKLVTKRKKRPKGNFV
jgi:hypothetical protein